MAKKTLSLRERPCKLGANIGGGAKGEGEDLSRVAVIPITGVMLSQPEIDKLCGDGTHARWYMPGVSGALEPAFGDIGVLPFTHRFTDSQVTLEINGDALTLANVKIHKINFLRQVGGMTHTEFAILASVDDHPEVTNLQRYTGDDIRGQFSFGKKASLDRKQKELPLDHKAGAEGEEDEGDEQEDNAKPKARGNGRQPAGAH